MRLDVDKFDLVSMEDAMNAKYWSKLNKHVVSIYIDYYWLVYDGDKLLIHKKHGSCMANQNEKIMKKCANRYDDKNLHIRRLGTIFIPWKN